MAKKSKSSGWLLLAGAAAAWFFWPSSASAATAPAPSAASQGYMNQIVAAQSAFTSGALPLAQYQAAAQAIMARATIDNSVSAAELANLHAVAGV